MTDKWKISVECCGNCAFWPLGYVAGDGEPFGQRGNHCDGSESTCQRHAPREVDQYGAAKWPLTKKRDFCGDFELRG